MSEIPSDLAEKLLAANLRNLVKKVSEGQGITQAEYEEMQRAAMDGRLPEELHKSRIAALARHYALGRPLTKEQRQELSAFLPVGKPIARRLTQESYRYTLAHYAREIGLEGKDPVRKLKRWIAKGREQTPPDLPPFDSLEHMAEWWRRNMEWRVPDYLLRLEDAAQEQDGAEASRPGPQEVEPSKTPPKSEQGEPGGHGSGAPMMFEAAHDMTADVGLTQIRELVKALYKSMKNAFESGRVKEAQNLMREWERAVENLRKWEKDLIKIQEGKGEVLRTRVINSELGRIFGVVSQSFFNALMAVLDKHAPEVPATERRQQALAYRDKCFAHLKSSKFAAVFQPGGDA